MNLTPLKSRISNTDSLSPTRWIKLRSWLLTWEIYLIVLVAGFLRLYRIDTTEFDIDQARIFRLAHDAVVHGLLPGTSNISSVHIAHPPAAIYVYALPAALSADPLWAAATVALFTTVGALLTYFFTRRYYGRLAGIIAALTYATAARPLYWASFIWQPNLMPLFIVLFMFALFWGVVERRKGWLFPALLLFGILYQLHETSILLAAPFLVALVLAPGTLRWRDLALGLVSLVIIFFPYLLAEVSINFVDLHTVFQLAKRHAVIDSEAIRNYLLFFRPFVDDWQKPTSHSLVYLLAPALAWLKYVVPLLVFAGFATAGLLFFRAQNGTRRTEGSGGATENVKTSFSNIVTRLYVWWTELRASPERCGLLLLLVWQIVPLLVLSRHAIVLNAYYFFMLLPGPYILIGLFLSRLVSWLQKTGIQWCVGRYIIYVLASLVIITQLVASTALIYDSSSGNVDDRSFQPYPYHNDLGSLERGLAEADQVAQQRHLNRVYITTDFATRDAMRYLAEQMHTPTTLFENANCVVLPNPADGPAVFLVGPYDEFTPALLNRFATATLVDEPMRIGGAPFRLYIVKSPAAPTASSGSFAGDLQFLDMQTQQFSFDNSYRLVTHWRLQRSEQPGFRTTYSYLMTAQPGGIASQCIFTAIRAGDQLLVAFGLPRGTTAPFSATIQAQFSVTTPYNPTFGPIHLETDLYRSTPWRRLRTVGGEDSITVSSS